MSETNRHHSIGLCSETKQAIDEVENLRRDAARREILQMMTKQASVQELRRAARDAVDVLADEQTPADEAVHQHAINCVVALADRLEAAERDLHDVAHALATIGCDPTTSLGPQVL